MRFRVVVTPEAQAGIREYFLYIHERAPLSAARWLQGLYARVDSLEQQPARCATARENAYYKEGLRQLLFKSHRVGPCGCSTFAMQGAGPRTSHRQ